MLGTSPQPTFYVCEWQGCEQTFENQGDLVAHVNDLHVRSSWNKNHRCRWNKCNNHQPFAYPQRMIEHMRVHTLERPYMCPIKGCGLKFSIRSNCVAHGKTKHNRAITPMVIDITRQFPEEGLEFDDPDDHEHLNPMTHRQKKRKVESKCQSMTEHTSELHILEHYRSTITKYRKWMEFLEIHIEQVQHRLERFDLENDLMHSPLYKTPALIMSDIQVHRQKMDHFLHTLDESIVPQVKTLMQQSDALITPPLTNTPSMDVCDSAMAIDDTPNDMIIDNAIHSLI